MKGDKPRSFKLLNKQLLTTELTADQPVFPACAHVQELGPGTKLGKHEYDESIEEMKHADRLIERVLFLEGLAQSAERFTS
jgi:bacterioferritin